MKRNRFTLIELLVVIVIIGILITLVASNYEGIFGSARELEANKNANSVEFALTGWSASNGGRPCYLLSYAYLHKVGSKTVKNPNNPRQKSFLKEDEFPKDPFLETEKMIGLGVSDVKFNADGKVIDYKQKYTDNGSDSKPSNADEAEGYLIYSVGPNERDDGGVFGPGADGKMGTDDDLDDVAKYIKF